MWPETIVAALAALGAVGASAAYVAHKARNYNGGFSESEIHTMNYRRNTTTPAWNDPDFNRREPPPSFRPPAPPPPALYGNATPPAPKDWAAFWNAQDEARREGNSRFSEDGGWRESPKDTQPPEYDGPTGS